MFTSSIRRRRPGRASRRSEFMSIERLEDRTVLSAVSVFDPASATWFLHTQNTSGAADAGIVKFGAPGTKAVSGDWDGNGVNGLGTFDPQTRTWTLRNDASEGNAEATFRFGYANALPVVGDWDGDGKDGVGTFDSKTGTWRLRNTLSSGRADLTFRFGAGGLPVVGDWNGDGRVGVGVFQPGKARWSLRNSLSGGPAQIVFNFGAGVGTIPVAGDWDGNGTYGIGTYNSSTAEFNLRNSTTAGAADLTFKYGSPNLQPVVGTFLALPPQVTPGEPGVTTEILTLVIGPIDLDLLGLKVHTDEIQVRITAESGDGKLLGNLLTGIANLLNLPSTNAALNNVLDTVVDVVNSVDLSVAGVGSGVFDTSQTTKITPVLDLFVAPIHLDLLGAIVDTSPIHVTITAESGPGKVLGNVVTALANLFNPPLPSRLDLNAINRALEKLLADLNAQIPGIPTAPIQTTPVPTGKQRVLALTIAPLDLDLLGLIVETSQIQVNVDAKTGNGLLLGNVLTTLLKTLGATPQSLNKLNANVNAILAKLVGVLNASELILPANALDPLSTVLHTLALPNLTTAQSGARAPILDLILASTDGTSPPVNVDLLGLQVTTSDVQAHIAAETGDGKVLGNLLYNLAHLLDSGGSLGLLTILKLLGL